MRKWSHGITLGIGLGIALAGACKEDGGTGDVPEDDAATRVAAEFCAAYFACNCGDFVDRYDSEADCKTEVAEDLQDDIDAGNGAELTYQESCPGLWIDALDTLECRTVVEAALDDESVDAVVDILECKLFYGTAAAGEPCTAPPGVNGDDCQRDLLCTNGICAVRVRGAAQGEACDAENGCDTGLFCADIDGDGESICEELPGSGETCLGALDLCGADLFCEQASKTCTFLPDIGDPCGPEALPVRCISGAACSSADDTCIAAPGAGEPCNGICDVGLMCMDGVCAQTQPFLCGGFGTND